MIGYSCHVLMSTEPRCQQSRNQFKYNLVIHSDYDHTIRERAETTVPQSVKQDRASFYLHLIFAHEIIFHRCFSRLRTGESGSTGCKRKPDVKKYF
jgi:hypothetical protein